MPWHASFIRGRIGSTSESLCMCLLFYINPTFSFKTDIMYRFIIYHDRYPTRDGINGLKTYGYLLQLQFMDYMPAVQGYTSSCWQVIIYTSTVVPTQNFPLRKKNFGSNFSEKVDYVLIFRIHTY